MDGVFGAYSGPFWKSWWEEHLPPCLGFWGQVDERQQTFSSPPPYFTLSCRPWAKHFQARLASQCLGILPQV